MNPLLDHYKAVRARLHAGRSPEPEPVLEPVPEPVLEPVPEIDFAALMAEAHTLADRPLWATAPAWKAIIREVAAKHHLSVEELIGPRRYAYLIPARFEAYYRLHQQGYSMPQIADRMGKRDHTTVMAGIKEYTRRFDPMSRTGDL
jgi:hypothetical protein